MIPHFDHVTVAVCDVERAKAFFAVLGFEVDQDVVIRGERFADYMAVEGIEAEHVTLVMPGSDPRLEVQLLHYRAPEPTSDPQIRNLCRIGFNHVCFAVDDLDGLVEKFRAAGFETRGGVLEFHRRKLVYLDGPEGVTVELAEWTAG
jgi:catechol 2,3-dioxygenase-like lactoylglutathione lyase family enzyme